MRFLLVHGAWHGGWCWQQLCPVLESLGHEVKAIDLPGRAGDGRDVGTVTYEDAIDTVARTANSFPNAVWVLHSMGGLMGSAVERVSDLPLGLVYLTAMYPNVFSYVEVCGGPAAMQEASAAMLDAGSTADRLILRSEVAIQIMYSDCTDEDKEWAVSQLVPESAHVAAALPLTHTQEKWGAVPKYYIECLRDATLPLAWQQQMRGNDPFRGIYQLDSGHSPFISQPVHLAGVLDQIASDLVANQSIKATSLLT